MLQFANSAEIALYLKELKETGKSIGFVPTMGALHKGHLELISKAKLETDFVVCSIFVNPLQFNRKEDLDNYPDRMEEDKKMLLSVDCDLLFSPTKEDLYSESPKLDYDFGSIIIGMEAEFRPNHFEGVAAVINQFFKVLHPNKAYFGEKDYQQLAIVRKLTEIEDFDIDIVACETVRYPSGLAMSSRNYLLTEIEMDVASKVYEVLQYCLSHKHEYSPKTLAKKCFHLLEADFKPEYFTIADENTMIPLERWTDSNRPRAFVAAYLSSVRLIDNLSLIP